MCSCKGAVRKRLAKTEQNKGLHRQRDRRAPEFMRGPPQLGANVKMLCLVDCSHVHHCSLSLSIVGAGSFRIPFLRLVSDAVAASIQGLSQPAKRALDSFCSVWRMVRFSNAALGHAGSRCYHLVDVSGSRLWWMMRCWCCRRHDGAGGWSV